MAKNDLFDFDETAASNNTDVAGVSIQEGCLPGGINDAIRGLVSIVKRAVGSQGSAIASATTTNIGAAGTALYTTVTGTTSITGLGTVNAGTLRICEFTGALTLSHNATSLKLPGSANITTAAGDVGFFISLGSGNWKCLHFQPVSGAPISLGPSATITSADAGAAGAPSFIADRNSASPAASDLIGAYASRGRSSTGVARDYAKFKGKILDPTNASEDGAALITALVAGTETTIITAGPGVQIGVPTGGDPGAGKMNATDVQINGASLLRPIFWLTQETSGAGGTATAGSANKRLLASKLNEISGASVASGVVTLPAGTYDIDGWAVAFAVDSHQCYFQNTSDATVTVLGGTNYSNNGGDFCASMSPIRGKFTIAGAKNFELRHDVVATNVTEGLGRDGDLASNNVFASLMITKVA